MSWLSNLASNTSVTLLLILLFFFPSQLGRHFWPPFAYLNGLRVDYLSPTFYFTDLIFIAVLIDLAPAFLNKVKKRYALVLIPLVVLLSLSPRTVSPWNSLLGVLRLGEVISLGGIIAYFLSRQEVLFSARRILSLSLLYTGFLAGLQMLSQRSVGGLWYYLGERSFTSLTPGIANASVHGDIILRPYATFPHPNVLAGYALIVYAFLLFFPQSSTQPRWWQRIELVALLVASLTILMTLSRTALVVWFGLTVFFLLKSYARSLLSGLLVLALLFTAGVLLSQADVGIRLTSLSLSDEAVIIREFLFKESLSIFQSYPVTGVGLQNFLPILSERLPAVTPLSYLQPVHSFMMMLLVETGIIGVSFFFLFLLATFYRIFWESPFLKTGKLVLLAVFFLLGLTDHYFYTLHQGQFLTAFIFGVLWMIPHEDFTSLKAKNLRTGKRQKKTVKKLSSRPVKNSRKGTSRAL